MTQKLTALQRSIMRRVYYAYALRIVTLPGIPQGFFMLGSIIALTYFVSIGNVIENFLQAPVGHLGVFFYNAFTNTEAWTLLTIGVFIFSLLSFRFTIKTPTATVLAKAQ
jgi:hypothetical protein